MFLRAPKAWEMSSVTANSKPFTNWNSAQEVVTLSWPDEGLSVLLEVHYRKK